ncbi:hypothetical protein [Pseudomonas sp. 34 E 7]|jgi:hypothetical protein|nr:hypothetical protein [Pseudomonas sp. 34 E 7]
MPPPVGASLLAKNVNDNACFLNERGAREFFASKLAPTKSLGIRACPLPHFVVWIRSVKPPRHPYSHLVYP